MEYLIPDKKIDEIISWFNGKLIKEDWNVLKFYKRCANILNKKDAYKHEDFIPAMLGMKTCKKYLPDYIKLSIKCAWYE